MIKIVFLATPDIAIKSFEFFINSPDYDVLALVSQPSKEKGRGNKIQDCNLVKIAKENNIDVYQPEKISKDPELIAHLRELEPDFLVTFAFGQILSQEVIDIPKISTINLHASMLPEYRGANPISQCIIEGKCKTGITTMKTVLELDKGDICLQESIDITPEMNVVELSDIISSLSPELLDKTLKGLYQGTLKSIPQDDTKATFTKKIKKEEKVIDWTKPSDEIHNKIRGMYQINTCHTTFKNKIVKILKTKCEKGSYECGCVEGFTKEGILVGSGEGLIEILTVKPEGKKEMRAIDWARGARIEVGDKLI